MFEMSDCSSITEKLNLDQISCMANYSQEKFSSNVWSRSLNRSDILWLLATMIVGLGLRIYFLNQPMRYDESFTFLNFVNRGVNDLFYYPLPNNHVLHTLLVKLSVFVFGIHPVSIRLPSFLAGIASIPAVFILCRELIPGKSGYFASASMAVFPFMVLYSTMARGYSLLVMMALILTLICHHYHQDLNWKKSVIIAVIAALGMLIMPSMLLVIAGIYVWVVCLLLINGETLTSILRRFILPVGVFTIVITFILYLPTIMITGGIGHITNNRFVSASPWSEFFTELLPHIHAVMSDFSRDIPLVMMIGVCFLTVAGILFAAKNKNLPLLSLFPCILLTSILVILAKHRIPFERTWIYLIPFFLIVADSGLTYIDGKMSGKDQQFLSLTVLVCASLFSILLMSRNSIADYPDTGSFPEATLVVERLKPMLNPNDRVYVKVPADWPIYFYLWYATHVEGFKPNDLETHAEYIVVSKNRYSVSDMTKMPVVKLLDQGNAALYKILPK